MQRSVGDCGARVRLGGTTLPECDGTQVLAGFENPRRS